MTMPPKDKLLQRDFIEKSVPRIGRDLWVCVNSDKEKADGCAYFSALVLPRAREAALSKHSWDIMRGNGMPGIITSFQGEEERSRYCRYGDDDRGIEPFVLNRYFAGPRTDYDEICEEFRLYFSLWEDPDTHNLLRLLDTGEEELAVRFNGRRIEVRLPVLREFLGVKGCALAVYFERDVFIESSLSELGMEQVDQMFNGDNWICHLGVHDAGLFKPPRVLSRLIGKVLINGMSFESATREEEAREYREFIIGHDEHGETVRYSCNHQELANFFGANPNAPQYTTPVFFRREVLQKYYAQSDRYTVQDGRVECHGFWSMRIDNNHSEYVIALLGDLGRDLPDAEEAYWHSFNVLPEGSISEVAYTRGVKGEFADPEASDLVFRQKYSETNRLWEEAHGWPLFLDMHEQDSHHLTSVRLPLTESQKECDEVIQSLVKLLVDSLNERRLIANMQGAIPSGSINRLQAFLEENGNTVGPEVVQFLRDLQSLRSYGVAHRKGGNFDKLMRRLGLDDQTRVETVRAILDRAVACLDKLIGVQPKT